MSINSLANFGVPGLNGDRSAVLQPIFSNRFRVLFFNFGATTEPAPYDLTRQIKSISRPTVDFDIQTIYSYVSTVYVNSRAEHGTCSITFLDDITNSVTTRVENQKSKQMNFFDQTMSRAGENYKFEMDLDVLAGGASAGGTAADPNIIQKWCYSGCQVQTVDYNEMSYDNATVMEISVTLRYDNVIGFNENGGRMGVFDHTQEIQSQSGLNSTGLGGGQNNSGGGLGGSLSGEITFGNENGSVTVGGTIGI